MSIPFLNLESASVSSEPFPHLTVHPALSAADYGLVRAALPDVTAFDMGGKGRKLDLDLVETNPTLLRVAADQQRVLLSLRDGVRQAAPSVAARFEAALREKYIWLLGDALAGDIIAAGWTTTNGRIMGRAPGYRLEPHLDSAHFGVTCLLYLSDASSAEQGALALFRPDRVPAVLNASTYYPDEMEGIQSAVAKTIPVQQNLFVAFVNGPTSLHGFTRDKKQAEGWRFVHQCHVVPSGLNMDSLFARLPPDRRARWQKYVSA